MSSPRSRFAPVAAAAALLLASPATAATMVEITTTVEASSSSVGHSIPGAGETVILQFTYDETVPDTSPAIGTGQFLDALLALRLEFPDSGLLYEWGGGGSIMATTDNFSSPGPGGTTAFSDTFVLGTTTGAISGLLDGDPLSSISYGFGTVEFGSSPTQVVNDLPNPPFVFDGLGVSAVIIQGLPPLLNNPYVDEFRLAAGTAVVVPVPEPGAGTMAISSLAAAALLLRRRNPA